MTLVHAPMARRISALRRRVVSAGAAACGLALLAVMASAPAQASAPSRPGSLTLLSVDPYTNSYSAHKTEVEPDTFSYGKTIVSAFQVGRVFIGASANIGFATSKNGGRTWMHGFLPASTTNASPPGAYARGSDASVTYDVRHHTWLISWLGAPSITSNAVVDVLVSRSHDGIHWSAPVTISARHEFLDKNWTACDNTRSSPFFGHCYTEFEDPSEGSLVFMATSTDGGRTWPLLGNTADMADGVGGQPVVQPDGRVIVPIEVFTSSAVTISSFISTDGGHSWSATHLVADVDFHNSAGNIRNGGVLPSAGEDGSGRVYMVWADCRFEPGCAANDLVLSISDNGTTWTAPTRIPIYAVGSGVDHFTPGLGVDPATSGGHAHLALGYYYYPQANCTVATCQLNVGYVSSADGGKAWSSPVHLAGPMKVTWLAPTSSGYMAGDYMSTSIVPGTPAAFPVFADAFRPAGSLLHENMYTSPQQVTGGGRLAGTAPVRGHAPLSRPATAPRIPF